MSRLYPLLIGSGLIVSLGSVARALPPPEDVPEEVLRTEIITEARSPLTGEPISAVDYAALQEHLRDPNTDPSLNPQLLELINLLQLRRIFKPILPFLR